MLKTDEKVEGGWFWKSKSLESAFKVRLELCDCLCGMRKFRERVDLCLDESLLLCRFDCFEVEGGEMSSSKLLTEMGCTIKMNK